MPLLKQFWIYLALLLLLVIAVIAFAIWDSMGLVSPEAPNAITDTQAINTSAQEPSEHLALEQAVPSDFPAPAKKLHQLLKDSDSHNTQAQDKQFLQEKVQQLNKQLAEINKQLKAQNIVVPEPPPQTAAINSDTEQRLKAVKDYISHK